MLITACLATLFHYRYIVLNAYEGYSKSSKTNSKKYFIYEIYQIIFLHSFHPIHNTSVSNVSIEKFQDKIFRWKHRLLKSVLNWMETM